MVIEAGISKSTKFWLLVYALGLVGFAGWFAYDGFLNESFIEAHTNEAGMADSTLRFNQKAPPFFLGGALLMGLRLFVVSKRRIVAEESELVIHNRVRIPYDAIQEIDKTHFKTKGVFTLAYDSPGGEHRVRLRSSAWRRNRSVVSTLAEVVSTGQFETRTARVPA